LGGHSWRGERVPGEEGGGFDLTPWWWYRHKWWWRWPRRRRATFLALSIVGISIWYQIQKFCFIICYAVKFDSWGLSFVTTFRLPFQGMRRLLWLWEVNESCKKLLRSLVSKVT
jgi:hypothetical protein